MKRGLRAIALMAASAALVLPATAEATPGKAHYATNAVVITNPINSDSQQKVTLYVNESDIVFGHNKQAVFNYDTDEGPCNARQVYVTYVQLLWKFHADDPWDTISRTDPAEWYTVGGAGCPDQDLFVSTPWDVRTCGYYKTEAKYKIEWRQIDGNISGPYTSYSNVHHPC